MHQKLLFLLLVIMPSFLYAQSYNKLHFKSIVVDTHNDLLSKAVEKNFTIDTDLSGKTHSDIDRFKKGGVDVQLFSVWCDGLKENPYAWANREMDTLDAVIKRNPEKISLSGTPSLLKKAVKQKKDIIQI